MKKILLIFIFFMFFVFIAASHAAVLDSDFDGVPDDEDQCPNSGTTIVDQFGCSCLQKNCPSDNNECTDDCSVIDGLPSCAFTNNDNSCQGGYCDKGECIQVIKEQVKCVFMNSTNTQECHNSKGGKCKGVETCVVDVKGKKGEEVTWKSSCGGYVYTIIDGRNKYAYFECGTQTNGTFPYNQTNETYPFNETNEILSLNQTNATFPVNLTNETQCYDSDGGKNYYLKGKVIWLNYTDTDFCTDSDTLVEFYCGDGGRRDSESYQCPNGCDNGVCLTTNLSEENITPQPPFNLKVSTAIADGSKIAKLEWQNVNGQKFKIYKNKEDGSFQYQAETEDKFYKDDSGLSNDIKYGYYVTALNVHGESEPSNSVYVYPSTEKVIEKKPNVFIRIRNFFRRLFS